MSSHIQHVLFLVCCACLQFGCGGSESPVVRVEIIEEAVKSDDNPLVYMIGERTIEELEAVLLEHPEWVNGRSSQGIVPDWQNFSPLSASAFMGRTNEVRLLLRYGADPNEAVDWCTRNKHSDGAELVRQVAQELEAAAGRAQSRPARND